MLWDELGVWSGAVEVNGQKFDSIGTARKTLEFSNQPISSIVLCSVNERAPERDKTRLESVPRDVYRITVRQYMTKPANANFDFMEKWNSNIPMPLRTMVGTIEKETAGMVYMKLHGDITSKVTQYCMKCGREITNPVSKFFGMGPECGGHHYVSPFNSDDELAQAVEEYRKNYLQKIVWEGWIIKSAIIEKEKLNGEQGE